MCLSRGGRCTHSSRLSLYHHRLMLFVRVNRLCQDISIDVDSEMMDHLCRDKDQE